MPQRSFSDTPCSTCLSVVLFAVALLFAPGFAKAGVLPNLVSGQANELEGVTFSMIVNAGGTISAPGVDTILNPGDFLVSMFRTTGLRVPPGGTLDPTFADTDATFTGVSLFKTAVVTKFLGGSQDGINDVLINYVAPTSAEWSSVFGIDAGGTVPASLAQLMPSNDSTLLTLFDDPDNIDPTTGSAATAFATVNGTKLWQFGFTGDVINERAESRTDTADVLTAFVGGQSGSTNIDLNVTALNGGPDLVPFVALGGTRSTQFHSANGVISSAWPNTFPPFQVGGVVDLLVSPASQVVPEPSSACLCRLSGSSASRGRGADAGNRLADDVSSPLCA